MKDAQRHSVTTSDIAIFGQLDMVYNHLRYVEAQQNETKYACQGSGRCCKIGLRVHMTECANIAYRIRHQYYLYLEDEGNKFADDYLASVIQKLTDAMYDDSWDPDGTTDRMCAFYDNGCTIYGYRPMVCRTFGSITHVDDFCPRERNESGNIDFYSGKPIEEAVKAFQDLLCKFSEGKPEGNYDMVIYMPLGVLSFFLPSDQLEELYQQTDEKFWQGNDGWFNYRTYFTKKYGYSDDELTASAKAAGLDIVFEDLLNESR